MVTHLLGGGYIMKVTMRSHKFKCGGGLFDTWAWVSPRKLQFRLTHKKIRVSA